MNRRDLLLNEMKITQWVLGKPQVLKGDAQIRLADSVKLVVICEQDRQQSGFFQDVLRSLNLARHQYQWFTFEQAMRLSFSHSPICWLIQPEAQAVSFQQKFAKFSPNLTACLHSSWEALQHPAAKRQFWQQIEPFRFEPLPETQ